MYPLFRLNPENIVLLTPREHEIFDQGTNAERVVYLTQHPKTKWALLEELKDKLKTDYKKLRYGFTNPTL
jgi:hypothetical protein